MGVYAPDTFIRLSVTVTVADAGGINIQPQVVVVRCILTFFLNNNLLTVFCLNIKTNSFVYPPRADFLTLNNTLAIFRVGPVRHFHTAYFSITGQSNPCMLPSSTVKNVCNNDESLHDNEDGIDTYFLKHNAAFSSQH